MVTDREVELLKELVVNGNQEIKRLQNTIIELNKERYKERWKNE